MATNQNTNSFTHIQDYYFTVSVIISYQYSLATPSDPGILMTQAVQILHDYSFTETSVVLLKMSNVWSPIYKRTVLTV